MNSQSGQSDWQRQLDRMKNTLLGICDDPASEGGRKLSEENQRALFEAAQPVYQLQRDMEQRLDMWKAVMRRLDEEEGRATVAVTPKEGFTEQDRQRLLAVRADFLSQRHVVMLNAEGDEQNYERLKKDLNETAAVCEAAAVSLK